MCAPYWPNEVGNMLKFDGFTVEVLESKEFEDYTQRELKLTQETVSVLCCSSDCVVMLLITSIRLASHTLSSSITTLGGQNMALLVQVLA